MPITTEFIRENRVVWQKYSDPLTVEDMRDLKQKMEQEILPAGGNNKVHIIADFSRVNLLPTSMLTGGTRMLENAHRNTGVIILIFKGDFIRIMAQTFSKLIPKQPVKFVKSYDEAVKVVDRLLEQKPEGIQ